MEAGLQVKPMTDLDPAQVNGQDCILFRYHCSSLRLGLRLFFPRMAADLVHRGPCRSALRQTCRQRAWTSRKLVALVDDQCEPRLESYGLHSATQ